MEVIARWHSGGTCYESYKAAFPVINLEHLSGLIHKRFDSTGDIDIEAYCHDDRDSLWNNTWLITLDGNAIGYTNGEVFTKAQLLKKKYARIWGNCEPYTPAQQAQADTRYNERFDCLLSRRYA